MNTAPAPEGLPPSLRFLRALVIVLALTMIVGVITIVGLLVTRLPAQFQATPALPDRITLPEGVHATAITQGPDWFAVVTSDERILIFARDGSLRQQVLIAPAP
ncbi:MAG: DUF6476 family protein [Pseudorhodobacter sp.]|nr:DUF6476 family protein [Pseudorhodobacter sp.]